MKKHSITLAGENDFVNSLKELKDFLSFYTFQYRWDPFMREEYQQQLDNVNKLIEQLERENE